MTQLLNMEFVAFDTETTGTSAHADAVVEIAAVRFHLEKGPLAHFQTFVHPGRAIPPALTKIHGITNAMVAHAPRIAEVLPHFFHFIEGAIPVAHNAAFDVDFLALPSIRNNIALPKIPVLDTCRFARRVCKDAPNHRLQTLAEFLGIGSTQFHRAAADSNSCMEIFRILVRDSVTYAATWEQALDAHGRVIYFHESVSPLEKTATSLPILPPILAAIQKHAKVLIEYEGSYSGREITPHILYTKGKSQYLDATCHIDQMRKTFRLDRIRRVLLP